MNDEQYTDVFSGPVSRKLLYDHVLKRNDLLYSMVYNTTARSQETIVKSVTGIYNGILDLPAILTVLYVAFFVDKYNYTITTKRLMLSSSRLATLLVLSENQLDKAILGL
ncbi:hypothetical protein BDF20DRAFT_832175 [Mycotypha africana]|uniref:uncharacterized protein n=1 Tax=Mycotypha africana TaxID=64632 RepID=UPI0023006E55|nr:uncharacterized protein BDF20DRAFT_832175 [Mycotypha africana]KAI8992197.1 hypothetical protein BDF20DRAFT_832175 [Mycotypha africana]